MADLGSPQSLLGQGHAGEGERGAGLPKCIRFSPELPLVDPFYHFEGRVYGKAAGVRYSDPIILLCPFRPLRPLRLCWTHLVSSKNIIPAPRRLGPQSSGHVPGALANRPKPCLGCFVYLHGGKSQPHLHVPGFSAQGCRRTTTGLTFLWSDYGPLCSCLDFCLFAFLWSPSRTSRYSHGSSGIHHDADA